MGPHWSGPFLLKRSTRPTENDAPGLPVLFLRHPQFDLVGLHTNGLKVCSGLVIFVVREIQAVHQYGIDRRGNADNKTRLLDSLHLVRNMRSHDQSRPYAQPPKGRLCHVSRTVVLPVQAR